MIGILAQVILLVFRVAAAGVGIFLFFLYWSILADWLGGFFGTILAFLTVPGMVVFPIIYWFVEGSWPIMYLVFCGIEIIVILAVSLLALMVE